MRLKQLEGQISIFNDDSRNQKIKPDQNNCFHCVMFESHRCKNKRNVLMDYIMKNI
jgi:hypothetical protein